MTKCIMLVRHAEKPGIGEDGVDDTGLPDNGSLSVQGWRRAGAFVPYFASLAERAHERMLCRPQYILAATSTEKHPSTRPRDTVEPLADRLGIWIDERWSDADPVDKVAEHLCALDAPVLVCWRHDGLPALGKAILQRDEVPTHWPADRFDVTWSFRLDASRWEFVQVPQLLLAGDRLEALRLQGSPAIRLARPRSEHAFAAMKDLSLR